MGGLTDDKFPDCYGSRLLLYLITSSIGRTPSHLTMLMKSFNRHKWFRLVYVYSTESLRWRFIYEWVSLRMCITKSHIYLWSIVVISIIEVWPVVCLLVLIHSTLRIVTFVSSTKSSCVTFRFVHPTQYIWSFVRFR